MLSATAVDGAHLARLAADHAEQVRTLLVRATLVGRVACRALGLEQLRAGLGLAVVRPSGRSSLAHSAAVVAAHAGRRSAVRERRSGKHSKHGVAV